MILCSYGLFWSKSTINIYDCFIMTMQEYTFFFFFFCAYRVDKVIFQQSTTLIFRQLAHTYMQEHTHTHTPGSEQHSWRVVCSVMIDVIQAGRPFLYSGSSVFLLSWADILTFSLSFSFFYSSLPLTHTHTHLIHLWTDYAYCMWVVVQRIWLYNRSQLENYNTRHVLIIM